ncbi:MAG TPA: hypothetical protein VML96_12020 [Egibacteraceae bacterium]|nr:hypothetical protein [Egibacteraceae bacterium]
MDERHDGGDEGDAADGGADTGMFRAFVESGESDRATGKAVGVPFRVITLLAGVAAFAVIVWLLLR